MFSIYVHIPFCLSKCHYCDFFSLGLGRKKIPEEAYLESLLQEMTQWVKRLRPNPHRKIGTVYFGGGTPSLFSAPTIEKSLRAMEALAPFSPSVEITLEVNPKTADLKKFREYLAAGVNRVSMGVQSLDDGILERLGRAHTAAEALQSLEGILETGFSRVNVDLMYGLPDQNPDNLHATLSRLGSYPLKHLSAYELIVEEETPFFEQQRLGQLRLPPTEEVLAMQRGIADFAKEHFLRPYEISNYAFRGHESRHNKNYWDYGSFLGLGAGAVSFLTREDLSPDFYSEFEKDAPREFYGFRFTHPRDLARYGHETRGGEGAAVEKISEETAMGEFMMMGLRKTEGIRYMDFEKKFFVPLPKKFSSAIEKMSERGWMLSDPQGCCLTAGGALLSNEVLQEFL